MTPSRAVALVRISDDREGEGQGVGRQEQDCRALAERLGWTLAEVVVENSTSAFKRRRVKQPDGSTVLRTIRPGFRKVLEMLDSGGADGLVAYDLDRVCRDMRDLEDLVDVIQQRRIPVTSVTGSLKLASDADVAMARILTVIANKSSADTARRVARKHEQLAEQGKPGGGGSRPYGYDKTGMTVIGHEAEIIREMVEKVMDGASLNSIMRDLNDRGVPPSRAAKWNTKSVSTLLRSPRIAGMRLFRGEVVGDATWPAIIDRDQWEALQPLLGDRSRGISNQLQRWLTGLLICGLCEKPLHGWAGSGGPRYWCASPRGGCGKITVSAPLAEDTIEERVLRFLEKPANLAALRGTYSSANLERARADLAADEEQLKELAAAFGRREISFVEYQEARKHIASRVEASRALVNATLPRTVQQLLASADVRAHWAGLGPADRRQVAQAVMPRYRVDPSPAGFRTYDPGRLVPLPN